MSLKFADFQQLQTLSQTLKWKHLNRFDVAYKRSCAVLLHSIILHQHQATES